MTNDKLSDVDYPAFSRESSIPTEQKKTNNQSKQFLLSSGIVFVGNIFTAFLNYSLIILILVKLDNPNGSY